MSDKIAKMQPNTFLVKSVLPSVVPKVSFFVTSNVVHTVHNKP